MLDRWERSQSWPGNQLKVEAKKVVLDWVKCKEIVFLAMVAVIYFLSVFFTPVIKPQSSFVKDVDFSNIIKHAITVKRKEFIKLVCLMHANCFSKSLYQWESDQKLIYQKCKEVHLDKTDCFIVQRFIFIYS